MLRIGGVRLTAALLLGLVAIGVCVAKGSGAVTIKNKSNWEIHELYLSAADEDEWGPDQLGKHVIATGGSYTLTDVPCDKYDVRLVDEDGDECVVAHVSLCAERNTWVIKDDDLLSCQSETEE
jgi:hypothetical protein